LEKHKKKSPKIQFHPKEPSCKIIENLSRGFQDTGEAHKKYVYLQVNTPITINMLLSIFGD
jgi:hypothetical protein